MELGAYVPAQGGYLDNLYQVGSRISACAVHACSIENRTIGIVELIAMAVTLAHRRAPCGFAARVIGRVSPAAFRKLTLVSPQTHGAAHVGDVLLLLHHVYDGVRRSRVHLGAVGILESQHVACKLNDHHLHAQANAECGHVVRAAVFSGDDLSLYAPLSETRTDDDTGKSRQQVFDGLGGDVFAVDEGYFHLTVIVGSGMCQALAYALVGILQFVLAHQPDGDSLPGTLAARQKAAPRIQVGGC